LWAGDGAVLSHEVAGVLWRLDGVVTHRIDLWVPRAIKTDSPLVAVHRGTLDSIDRRLVEGTWVTSVPRTLIDLASILDFEALETAVESAFRRGIATPTSVERRLAALGGRGKRGTGPLRALLMDRGNAAALESRLEVKVWRLLRRARLRPVRQYAVHYENRTFRLDFAWPALRVAVECDGFDAHAGKPVFERDHARLAILNAHGWLVVPVTWKQVTESPELVLENVFGAMRSAAA
jgi:very-short-patch-repair endonuclease